MNDQERLIREIAQRLRHIADTMDRNQSTLQCFIDSLMYYFKL